MKTVVFHPLARQELLEAVTYYDEQSSALGRDLNNHVKLAAASIATHPAHFAFLRTPPFRAVRLKRFPYMVIYLDLPEYIWIAAVAHERRRPDYWKNRKPADP